MQQKPHNHAAHKDNVPSCLLAEGFDIQPKDCEVDQTSGQTSPRITVTDEGPSPLPSGSSEAQQPLLTPGGRQQTDGAGSKGDLPPPDLPPGLLLRVMDWLKQQERCYIGGRGAL